MILIKRVTFDKPFQERPIVVITMGGDHGNTAIAYGNGGNTIHGHTGSKAHSVTVNGFTAYVWGGTYSAGDIVYYQWIAIGR